MMYGGSGAVGTSQRMGIPPDRGSVSRALTTLFNVVALSVSMVVLSCAVVTVPITIGAAMRSVYSWRVLGDDRMVRNLWVAGVARPLRNWLAIGVPMCATGVGVLEVRQCASSATPTGGVCVAFGALTVMLSISVTAYTSLLLATGTTVRVRTVWACAWVTACRVPLATAGVSLLALLGGALGYIDPALVVVIIPVGVVIGWYHLARWGVLRSGVGRVVGPQAAASRQSKDRL